MTPPLAPPSARHRCRFLTVDARTGGRRRGHRSGRSQATGRAGISLSAHTHGARPASQTLERALTPSRSVAVGSTTSEFSGAVSLARASRSRERRLRRRDDARSFDDGPCRPPRCSPPRAHDRRLRLQLDRAERDRVNPHADAEPHGAVVTSASNAGPPPRSPRRNRGDTGWIPRLFCHRYPAEATGRQEAGKPAAPVALPSLRRLVVPKVAMPSMDSLIRAPQGRARR